MKEASTGRPVLEGGASHSSETIEETLLQLMRERVGRGNARTICPSEVSRALEGSDEKRWRLLMRPVRAVAVRLAQAGTVEIRRKGKVVDPANFKGVYRIGLPATEASAPPDAPAPPETSADDRAANTNEPQGDPT